MLKHERSHRPLTRLAAAVACGLVLVVIAPAWAGGTTDQFVAGSGNAYAQVVRVGPTAGRLSLAPILGVTLSDYTETVARAESEAADLAAIGVASPCTDAQVPRVRVTSADPGSEKGTSTTFIGQNGNGIGDLFASATKAPLASSRFRMSSFSIPGVIGMHGGVATAQSGIVTEKGKKLRQAVATATINEFDFGPVALRGMIWKAVQTTDAKDHRSVTGSFTLGGATIGGVPLPVSGGQLNSVLGPINTALAPTGFAIAPPVFDKSGGLADVSPLAIQVVNSPLGRQFLGPILGALQPVRQPITDQLIPLLQQPKNIVGGNPNDCSQTTFPDLSVAVLVTDLAVGVAAGSSELHIELGGASAYTEGTQYTNPFNFNVPNLSSRGAPQTVFSPGSAGSPSIPGVPGSTGDTAQLASGNEIPRSDKTIPGGKGGLAIAVGLVGIAAALGLAAADWYRMRRSRRAA